MTYFKIHHWLSDPSVKDQVGISGLRWIKNIFVFLFSSFRWTHWKISILLFLLHNKNTKKQTEKIFLLQILEKNFNIDILHFVRQENLAWTQFFFFLSLLHTYIPISLSLYISHTNTFFPFAHTLSCSFVREKSSNLNVLKKSQLMSIHLDATKTCLKILKILFLKKTASSVHFLVEKMLAKIDEGFSKRNTHDLQNLLHLKIWVKLVVIRKM